jgi:endonuclease/exonuclease/phosphatase family metal-dependent hydrolase
MTESGVGEPDPSISSHIRVASWNVWANFGAWRDRYKSIAATLKRAAPDLVLLQEVWRDDAFDAVDFLASALGFHAAAAIDWFEPMTLHCGAAIVSRWPISGVDTLVPPAAHPAGSGLFQAADIAGPRGGILAVNAMLAWRPDHSDIRQAQATALGAWIKQRRRRGEAVVLGGDFNAAPDSDEMRAFTGQTKVTAPGLVFHDAWAATRPGEPGHSWSRSNPHTRPAALPDRRIDYILSAWGGPNGLGEPIAAGLLGDGGAGGDVASDHYGLWADLRY